MPGSGASPRATRTTRSGSSAASSGPRPNRRDMRSAAPRKKLEGDSPRAAPMIRFERASSRRPDARPRRPDSTTPPRAVSAITWSSRSGPRNVRASPRNGGSGHELQGSVFAGQPAFDQVSRTSKQSPAYRPTRHHPLTCRIRRSEARTEPPTALGSFPSVGLSGKSKSAAPLRLVSITPSAPGH